MSTKRRPLTLKNRVAIEETLEGLYSAAGAICSLEKTKAFRREFYQPVWDLLNEFENRYCRADWRAYRAWANRFGSETGFHAEPCDAWYELGQPWFDEDEAG